MEPAPTEEEAKDLYAEIKKRDSFEGVFNIEFSGSRRKRVENVRIVHWKMSPNAELFYLIGDDGSVYNFNNIDYMTRVCD